jgi:hypothetical protein
MLGLKPKTRPHAPPAKAWRNYYRVYRVINISPLGTIFPGLIAGPTIFVSKEIAEHHALSLLGAINPPGRSVIMEYAGAYPEGDRAN